MSDTTSKRQSVALLDRWDEPIKRDHGVFAMGNGVDMPGQWKQPLSSIFPDPKAIPTPFSRGEAMRIVLAHAEDAQAINHPMLAQFRTLLLGVAAGLIAVEPQDLAREDEFDNLGRALLRIEPDARHYCALRWVTAGESRLFGISYHASLFAPHARRQSSEWDELNEALKPLVPDALEVVAAWRQAFVNAGRWNVELCEWQRGVDVVLKASAPKTSVDPDLLKKHTQLVGPLHVRLPTGVAESPVRVDFVYLPKRSQGFAAKVLQLAYFQPKLSGDRIAFLDASKREIAHVDLPAGVSGVNPLRIGAGTIEIPADVPKVQSASGERWLDSRGNQPGIVESLRPIVQALEEAGRSFAGAAVAKCPVLYPDSLRILVEHGYWPGSQAERRYSSRLMDSRLNLGLDVPDRESAEREGGLALDLGPDTNPLTLVFVDKIGETQILDLRAIGYIMWLVFTHEAEPSSDLGGQLAVSATLERLLEVKGGHPLEPRAWVYEAVSSRPEPQLSRRLATLQRFLLANSSASSNPLGRLRALAARSFARWASEREVMPLGRASTSSASYRLPTGETFELPTDDIVT